MSLVSEVRVVGAAGHFGDAGDGTSFVVVSVRLTVDEPSAWLVVFSVVSVVEVSPVFVVVVDCVRVVMVDCGAALCPQAATARADTRRNAEIVNRPET